MIYSLVLLNKPVINADRNEKMGRVKGYVIDPDEKRVLALILAPDTEKDSLDIIPFASVKRVYDNAAIVGDLSAAVPISEAPEILNVFLKDVALIGAQVITDTGMLAGSVHDFAFDVKTGDITQISLIPEMPGVSRVHAKYIRKITQTRIMLSSEALEDVPPAPEPRQKPDKKKTTEDQAPISSPPEPESTATKSEPAASVTGEHADAKQSDTAMDADISQDVRDFIKESFFEMTSIIMGRLNAIDPAETVSRLKEELPGILESIKSAPREPDTAAELLLEEKIKRALSQPMQELKSELERVRELARTAADRPQPEINLDPPDLSSVTDAIAALDDKLAQGLSDIGDAASQKAGASQQQIADTLKQLAADMDSIRSKIPNRDDIRKQLGDYSTRFEERANALNKSFLAELDRQMHSVVEKLDSARAAFKAPSELPEKIEASLRNLIEDFRDQFASQLAVDLDEQFTAKLEKSVASGIQSASDTAAASSSNLTLQLDSLTKTLKSELESGMSRIAETPAMLPDSYIESINSIIEMVTKINEQPSAPDMSGVENSVREEIGRISGELRAAADSSQSGWNSIAEQLETIKNSITGTLDARLAEISGRTESVSGETRDMIAKIESAVSDRVDRLSGETRDLAGRLDAMLSELKNRFDLFKPEEKSDEIEQELEKIKEILIADAESVKNGWDNVRRGLDLLSEKMTDRIESGLAKRNDDVIEASEAVREIVRGIDNHVIELRERNAVIESELEQVRKSILDEIQSYTDTTLKPEDLLIVREWLGEMVPKISDAIATKVDEGIRAAAEELKRVAENTRGQFDALTDSIGLAGENLSQLADRISVEFVKQLEEKISQAAERGASSESLEELKNEMRDKLAAMGESLGEELRKTAGERAEEGEKLSQRLNESLEAAVARMREHLHAGLEAGRQELAEIKDLEQLRDRLEDRVGNVVDDMVGRIESRLDQRDRYYEEGVRSILNNIEKLLSRGVRPDLEGIFSGGGLISNLFGGGQRSGSSMKLTGGASQRPGAKTADHSDAQIRRFAYLLGKKLRTDITDEAGSVLAAEGDVVDEAMIHRLRDNQRTLELIRSVDFNT